jgi:hypothetical protein
MKYQAANWKSTQAKIGLNESYRVLVQLIDEILNAYSPTLQASPTPSASASSPNRLRVRDAKGSEQEVEIVQLSQRGERLFWGRTEVTFAGYLKQDMHVIFPVPTFEMMNPHILKLMRNELSQNQYERSLRYWRACEIRIQELGTHYENSLLEQLRAWLT